MLTVFRRRLLLILAAGAILPASARAQLPGPIPSMTLASGTLSFDGHATVGDFTGTTKTLTGEMTGGDDLGAVRGWVESPVKTLDSDNKKRDKDLNKSMESDKHPTMRFELTGVTPGATKGDTAAVRLAGKLTLHGMTREVTMPGKVWTEGVGLRLRTDFPVDLGDYEIGGLTKMLGVLRMEEGIEVHVDLSFAPR